MTSISRFIQRLGSYSRAFARLDELVGALSNNPVSQLFTLEEPGLSHEIAREALIKRFEFTQELSWNLLKDYLSYQGETDIAGSRDTYRRALKLGLIDDRLWMDMINDRNLSAHDYNDRKSKEITDRIIHSYHPLLKRLLSDMKLKMRAIPPEEKL